MRVRQCSFFLGVFFGLLLLLPAPARAQMGGLEGEVRDFDGNPMPDVTIVIERTDIKAHFETKTDSKGQYVYAGLTAGRAHYTIRAIKDGKQLYEFTNVMIPTGDMKRQDFNLKQLRKEDEERMTEEQKRMRQEAMKAMEKDKSLRTEFNLGLKLMRDPNAANLCAARCRASSPADSAACIAACTEETGQNTQELAYQEAAAAFERASVIDPTQYAVWANLGRAYQAANNPEKSIAAYERAIAVKPEQAVELYALLAPLYISANRLEDARQSCEKVAPVNPDQGSACYYNIGVIMYNNGKLKEAIEPLQKATELDPKHADAFYWLGVCMFNQAEFKQEEGKLVTILKPGTREAFEQYLTLEPEGRFAKDAKDMLASIEAVVPTAVRVKKKK